MLTVDSLIDGLCRIRDEEFTCDNVYGFLSGTRVDPESLSRFLFWSEKCYTRNLIYKDERFEAMAICWDTGQISRIHDHADQKCWMMVVSGRLRGQNFRAVEMDASGHCLLEETDRFDLSDCLSAKVELEEPIHQILNLPEFGERAVSLHIYSRPFDECLSFCRETNTFRQVRLSYTSVDGQLCADATI
jgi:cysteine dioxygenase